MRFQEKKPNIFPCGIFLSCVLNDMFIKVPWFQENSPALKNFWLRACFSYIFSIKLEILLDIPIDLIIFHNSFLHIVSKVLLKSTKWYGRLSLHFFLIYLTIKKASIVLLLGLNPYCLPLVNNYVFSCILLKKILVSTFPRKEKKAIAL